MSNGRRLRRNLAVAREARPEPASQPVGYQRARSLVVRRGGKAAVAVPRAKPRRHVAS